MEIAPAIRLTCLCLGAVACASSSKPVSGLAPPPPNIILVMADDIGIEGFGVYGSESYETPHIDELARSGMTFARAYAQPLCTPTRLQVMTGKYNFRNWKAFGILDPGERTFAPLMKAARYRTAIIGKWQLFSYDPPEMPTWRGKGTSAEQAGFDEHLLWHAGHSEDQGSRYADPTLLDNGRLTQATGGAYGPDLLADRVDDFIRRHRDRPFFVYYPLVLPHDPLVPTPDSEDWKDPAKRHVDAKAAFPDLVSAMGKAAGRTRYFADMVRYLDKMVGRMVRTLEEEGLRRRTVVLFTSDNGTHRAVESRMRGRTIMGGKGKTTDNGIHVPLIASWPGTIPAGRVCDDIVDSTDYLPTLLELAGAARPPACGPTPDAACIDGRSFAPQLLGRAGAPREWAFFHHDPRPGAKKDQYSLVRMALDKRYKLYDDDRLYDIDADPEEKTPLPAGRVGGAAEASRAKLRRVLQSLRP